MTGSRDPRLTELDVAVVKGQKWGAVTGIIMLVLTAIVYACGVRW